MFFFVMKFSWLGDKLKGCEFLEKVVKATKDLFENFWPKEPNFKVESFPPYLDIDSSLSLEHIGIPKTLNLGF